MDFTVLLAKLEHYGVRGVANTWFKNYLHGRTQCTECTGTRSNPRTVHTGVPQGSVTGPLLFVLLINDLHSAQDCNTILFADDTTLQVTGLTHSAVYQKMNNVLSDTVQWFNANYLTLNISKTKYNRYIPTNKHFHEIKLKIGDTEIERIGSDCTTKTYKFLGLNVDDSLDWTLHIQATRKKLNSGSFGLSSSKNFIPYNARCNIFNSLIMSHLNYCSTIFGCSNINNLNYLNNCQKKAIRHVWLARCNAHTKPLLIKIKQLEKIDSWRLINIVPALSKIAEKAIMRQIMSHLDNNKLINTNHHRSVPGHSTQTLILELHDKLTQSLEMDDHDTALILIDQSKAYNLVPHSILIDKLRILNYSEKMIITIKNYLQDH